MKVLLRRNVTKLGKIGEVVDVAPGYARNYLLPQRLGVEPTEGNLKVIEAEKQSYLEQVARETAELQAQADAIEGKELTITARSTSDGHLYGSVGPAQIAAALAEDGVLINSKYISLDNPIRQLDKYDVTVSFGEEVAATIQVSIVPLHDDDDDDDDMYVAPAAPAEPAEPQGESSTEEQA